MGMLVDGEWERNPEQVEDDTDEFVRQETTFRDRIGDGRFPAETGRYHLYISRACPWAHGVALVQTLTGLEGAVSMDIVDPYREDDGWTFSPDRAGCTPDTVNGARHLHEVYTKADPAYTGRVTVPVLWDTVEETIVNNESIEIMRMLDTEFAPLKERDVPLYPAGLRERIDELVDVIYQPINNGVYRAGFAGSQEAYATAAAELFDALDHWDQVLETDRYLAGDRFTLADVRLFPTLVRFDPVYYIHFKCSRHRIVDYPNLWGYLKELYQLPGVAGTVSMDHIKEHYYRSHRSLNPKGIVPVGPTPDLTAPHDRDELAGELPAAIN